MNVDVDVYKEWEPEDDRYINGKLVWRERILGLVSDDPREPQHLDDIVIVWPSAEFKLEAERAGSAEQLLKKMVEQEPLVVRWDQDYIQYTEVLGAHYFAFFGCVVDVPELILRVTNSSKIATHDGWWDALDEERWEAERERLFSSNESSNDEYD